MGRTTLTYYVIPGLKTKKIRFQRIISSVADYYEISTRNMMSKSRHREYVLARNLCFYILQKYFKMTLKEIGRTFNRDHTTVIHGIRMFHQDRQVNEQYEQDYQKLKIHLDLRKSSELEK